MKAAPTYLMFVFIILSGTLYCQEDSTFLKKQTNENISRIEAPLKKPNQKKIIQESKLQVFPESNIHSKNVVNSEVSTKDLNKTENQAKVIYEISEVATPRTTIDFF